VPRSFSSHLALIGAIAAVALLSGCGRKGALDPPPGGYALPTALTRTPVTSAGTREPAAEPPKQQEYDEQGRPIAPPGQRRRIPADWLID